MTWKRWYQWAHFHRLFTMQLSWLENLAFSTSGLTDFVLFKTTFETGYLEELSNMGNIFQNATCTIPATAAEGSDSGLFSCHMVDVDYGDSRLQNLLTTHSVYMLCFLNGQRIGDVFWSRPLPINDEPRFHPDQIATDFRRWALQMWIGPLEAGLYRKGCFLVASFIMQATSHSGNVNKNFLASHTRTECTWKDFLPFPSQPCLLVSIEIPT